MIGLNGGVMSRDIRLPEPADPHACATIIEAIERWMRKNLGRPGDQPATNEQWFDLTADLIAWCNQHAKHVDTTFLGRFLHAGQVLTSPATGNDSQREVMRDALNDSRAKLIQELTNLQAWLKVRALGTPATE